MLITRNVGETDEQLIYRVCSVKDSIGTWTDVANILNNLLDKSYDESVYRKKYQAFNTIFNANQDKFVTDKAQLEDIEMQQEILRKERIKLQTVNIERNRIDRQEARKELWYEQVGQYIKTLDTPKLENIEYKRESNKDKIYIQTLADIHYGANFISTNNKYSRDIARQRFSLLKAKTIDFIKEKGLTQLYIIDLGDEIQGILRANDLSVNDTTVVKCVVEVSDLIAQYLNDLSAYCRIKFYDILYANHSQTRFIGTKANEMMFEDLGYIIGHYIQTALKDNDRVEVIMPKENDLYLDFNVFAYNIIALHGHQIKNIDNVLKDLSIQRRTLYDYVLLGHYHSNSTIQSGESYLNDCEVLVAPSICGSDPFSDSIFKGSKPSSLIWGFERFGGHTETYKILLD